MIHERNFLVKMRMNWDLLIEEGKETICDRNMIALC